MAISRLIPRLPIGLRQRGRRNQCNVWRRNLICTLEDHAQISLVMANGSSSLQDVFFLGSSGSKRCIFRPKVQRQLEFASDGLRNCCFLFVLFVWMDVLFTVWQNYSLRNCCLLFVLGESPMVTDTLLLSMGDYSHGRKDIYTHTHTH